MLKADNRCNRHPSGVFLVDYNIFDTFLVFFC